MIQLDLAFPLAALGISGAKPSLSEHFAGTHLQGPVGSSAFPPAIAGSPGPTGEQLLPQPCGASLSLPLGSPEGFVML